MASTSDVSELLLRWHELQQQGRAVSPEELCPDVPGLLDELKRRIAAVQTMEQRIGLPAGAAPPGTDAGTVAVPGSETPSGAGLPPSIPGYELLGVLGQGGMGVVYKARQLKLRRLVAVKMIRGDFQPKPQQMTRFWREAEAVAQLQHPHIVQVYEFGETDGRPYFSMELVEGGNLAQKLAGRPLPPRAAAEIAAILAEAIHYAHRQGVVHRDLKPANILLSFSRSPPGSAGGARDTMPAIPGGERLSDAVLKITDFGLAKRLTGDSAPSLMSAQTQSGVVLGTPSYMAPEQAAGKSKDTGPLADVYALGALLYEMLTGRPPFVGESPLDTLLQALSAEPEPPSRLQSAVPRDLEIICLKCLEKAPGRRYASAADLGEDLRRFLNGAPIAARADSTFRRVRKWGKRRPFGAVLLAALLLGPAGLLAWKSWADYRQEMEVRRTAAELAPQARELLHKYCYECHGQNPRKLAGNLDVFNADMLRDPERRLLVPFDPAASKLLKRIGDNSMPPEKEEEYPRLSDEETGVLRKWVAGGAPPFAEDRPPPPPPSPPIAATVKQIFAAKCYSCHGFPDAENGIKILNYDLLVVKRRVIVPGDPDGSPLYQQLRLADGAEKKMPPQGEEPLTPEEIETVRSWIAQGAPAFGRARAVKKPARP